MTSDVPYNLMGLCGGLIVACAYVPQLARVIKRKQSADLSYTHLVRDVYVYDAFQTQRIHLYVACSIGSRPR